MMYKEISNKGQVSTKSTNAVLSGVLFLLHPLTAFAIALKNYNSRELLYVLVLFTSYYGFSVMPNKDSNDLNFYLNILPIYNAMPSSAFPEIIDSVINQSDERSDTDLYRAVMVFLVSRFTGDGHVLMAVFGFVYGLFFVMSISLFLKQSSRRNLLFALLLITFAFKLPLNLLGGVRYGTAGYLFFFGVVSYFNSGHKKFILVVLSSCLIHFAYLPLTLLFLLHNFIKKYHNAYFALFAISFLDLQIGSYMQSLFESKSGAFAGRVNSYTDEENFQEKSVKLQAASIQVRLQWLLQEISFYIATFFFLLRNRYNIIITDYSRNVFLFTLLLYSFANMTKSVLSLGERTLIIAMMFFAYFLYVLLKDNYNNVTVRVLCMVAFAFGIIRVLISIQSIYLSLGGEFFFGNFFTTDFRNP